MALYQTFIVVPFLLALFLTGLFTLFFEVSRSESYTSIFAKPSDFFVPISGVSTRNGVRCRIKASARRPIPRKFLTFQVAYAGCMSVFPLVFINVSRLVDNMNSWKVANWKGGYLIAAIISILSFSISLAISSYFLKPLEVQWLNEYLSKTLDCD